MPFFNLHGIKWHYPEGVDFNSIRHLIPMARSDADLMRARNPGLQVSAFTRPGMYAIRNNFGATDVHLVGGIPPIEVRPEPVSMEVQVDVQYIVYDIMDRFPTWDDYDWLYTGNYLATKVAVNAQGMARAMSGVPYHKLGDKKFFSVHDTTTIEPVRVVSGNNLREATKVAMDSAYNFDLDRSVTIDATETDDRWWTGSSWHRKNVVYNYELKVQGVIKHTWTMYRTVNQYSSNNIEKFRWHNFSPVVDLRSGEYWVTIIGDAYWPPVDMTVNGYPYIMANKGMKPVYVNYGNPGMATDDGKYYILVYSRWETAEPLPPGVALRNITYSYKEYPNKPRTKIWPYCKRIKEDVTDLDRATLLGFRVYNGGDTYLYCLCREFVKYVGEGADYWNTYEYILATRDGSGIMKETTLEYTGRVDPDGNLPGHEVELDGETYYLAGHIKLAEETALYIVEPHIP